jgi:putative ABC transport system permease protein
MLLVEITLMAWRSLGANKLRSALTVSGIMIGIFSVISVMTTISALQASIETGLTFLGSNIFQLSKYPVNFSVVGDSRFKNRRNISYSDYLEFARLMGTEAGLICPKVWDNGQQAVFGNRKTNPNLELCGTNEGFTTANEFQIEDGRNLLKEDVEFDRAVCVVGQQVFQRLFPQRAAVGQTIRIDERKYEVVGVFASKGGAFGSNDDNIVAIPITRFFQDFGSKNRTISLAVEARNQLVYERTKGLAIGALRRARGLRPEDPNDFEIYSNDSLAAAFRSIAETVRIGAFVISTVALIAAGVGIMNIMLVSVTERTREIGVRKALGARQRDIRRQFLLEALFLSLFGAFSGIVFGVVAGNVLATWLQAQVVFPWGWSLAGVLVCSAIGIGFGFYPAQKAASLDPIEALRYE